MNQTQKTEPDSENFILTKGLHNKKIHDKYIAVARTAYLVKTGLKSTFAEVDKSYPSISAVPPDFSSNIH